MANSAIPKFFKRASKTDPQSSSIDESFEETQSAPALSRKEYSEDYNHPSKFVEAMKNPNWRHRSDDSGPYAPSSTELSYHDVKAPEKKKGPETSGSISYLSGHGPTRSPNFWDHIAADAAATHWKSGRGKYHTGKEYSQASSSENIGSSSEYSRETDFHVIGHLDLPGIKSQGNPISVFELTPISAGRPLSAQRDVGKNALPSKLVHVQRIKRETCSPVRVHECAEMRNMPHKSPAALAWGEIAGRIAGHSTTRIKQARKAVIEDPAVARIGDCRRVPEPKTEPNDGYNMSLGFYDEGEKICTDNKYVKKEDAGFLKLLHKLKKRPDQGIDIQQGQKRSAPVQVSALVGEAKQRWESHRDTRKLTSTDSALGSFDETFGIHSKESSADSGVFIDSKDQSISLNPRAREFLSLNAPGFPATEQGVTSKLPSQPTFKLFGRSDSDSSVCFTPSQSSEYSETPCEPFPIIGSNLLPALTRSLPSNVRGAFPFAGLTAPGLAPPPGLGLGHPPVTPAGVPMASFPNGPMQPLSCGPPPMTNSTTLMPPMGFVPSPTAVPFTPLGAPGVINVRVKPVPKPRIPDPVSQQNYEAWLEFRKATEPGYALSCKQRQQFRAYRNPQDLSSSGVKVQESAVVKAE